MLALFLMCRVGIGVQEHHGDRRHSDGAQRIVIWAALPPS